MTDGFPRSVLHVTDVEASLRFYVDRASPALALRRGWQSERRTGRSRGLRPYFCRPLAGEGWQGADVHFLECRARGPDRRVGRAARAELEGKGVPVKEDSWG